MMETLRTKDVVTPTKNELFWGILCWFMYALGFPLLLSLIFDVETPGGSYWFQITHFICCFLLTGGLFFRFLGRSSRPLRGKWKTVFFAVIQGFAAYFVLRMLFEWLSFQILSWTETQLKVPNQEAVEGLMAYDFAPMAICSILLAPVTEEILSRGMVFAPLCQKWPWVGYVATTLLFAGMHTLGFIGQVSAVQSLTSFLIYIPAGLVMGWMYQKTKSIYGPIFLHMLVNFIAVFG